MLRGARPAQAFLTVRKRPKFFFQAKVLFPGFGWPSVAGPLLVAKLIDPAGKLVHRTLYPPIRRFPGHDRVRGCRKAQRNESLT